ncbi:MAG: DUF1127 domain-containing protein [Pseudomonadota bacterium]
MSTIRTASEGSAGLAVFHSPRLRQTRHRSALSGILATLLLWQERAAQRRALRALDPHELADIGVTRAAALSEAEKPFWRP